MDAILVVNAGSSSLKFQVFATGRSGGELDCLVKGQVDGVGTRPRLRAESPDKKSLIDQTYGADKVPDLPAAIQVAGDWLRSTQKVNLLAVGHRVVHGGPDFDRAVRVTPEVATQLERYTSLAPLHQPNNLAPIRALLERRPELPQVACFDTAFHRGHGELADYYALPERFYKEGVRRYGFHGLSYEYIAQRLPHVAPEIAKGRVIVAHLGIDERRSAECRAAVNDAVSDGQRRHVASKVVAEPADDAREGLGVFVRGDAGGSIQGGVGEHAPVPIFGNEMGRGGEPFNLPANIEDGLGPDDAVHREFQTR